MKLPDITHLAAEAVKPGNVGSPPCPRCGWAAKGYTRATRGRVHNPKSLKANERIGCCGCCGGFYVGRFPGMTSRHATPHEIREWMSLTSAERVAEFREHHDRAVKNLIG